MKGILLVLFALPFSAVRAEPIIAEFEGTIDSVFNDPEYAVGDRITGRLFIDTQLAGPDRSPPLNTGRWGDNGTEVWQNFVTGFATGFAGSDDPTGLGTDEASITNNALLNGRHTDLDVYHVSHDVYYARASFLTVAARIHGMLDDADLRQSFEVTSADVDKEDESLIGQISRGFESGASFVISRLTVRPGHCFASS